MYDKNTLREKIKQMRKNLTHDEITQKSEKITSLLTETQIYRNAKCVCIYMASFNEPRTIPLIRKAISDGKKICVPITNTENTTLSLSYVNDITSLKKGAYGISEPAVIDTANPCDVDLIIVPGIAFDRNGNRIGFGKGFYDRLLTDTIAVKIGLCYNFQLCEGITSDKHDIPMNIIITEEGLIICK